MALLCPFSQSERIAKIKWVTTENKMVGSVSSHFDLFVLRRCQYIFLGSVALKHRHSIPELNKRRLKATIFFLGRSMILLLYSNAFLGNEMDALRCDEVGHD